MEKKRRILTNKEKAAIIISSIIVILGAVWTVTFFIDNKEEIDRNNNSTTIIEEGKNISVNDLYNYFDEHKEEFKASFKYIDATDSIQVTFDSVKSEYLKDIFIMKDEETDTIYLRDSNENLYPVQPDNWIFHLPLPDGTGANYVYATLAKSINDYYNSIPEDAGDEKDYGEDVNITTNPDGSLGINKD